MNTNEDIQVQSTKNVQNSDKFCISGRRVVDIHYFIKIIQSINNHGPFGCSISDMDVVAETRKGLNTGIHLKCKMCNFQDVVWTEDPNSEAMRINTAAVSGIMSVGGGFSNLEEFLSCLNVPSMSSNTYTKEHDYVTSMWEQTALQEMEKAAMEEKRLALEANDVDPDGIPFLTVVVDGCWGKRSYKTNYSSLSGAVSKTYMIDVF